MFYCEACRKKNNWPIGLFTSGGQCEVCGKVSVCYKVHHSELPKVKEEKDDTKV